MRKNEDLHRLIDRCTPEQIDEIRSHVLRLARDQDEEGEKVAAQMRSTPRDLSFIGLIHAESDLAERSHEVAAERFSY